MKKTLPSAFLISLVICAFAFTGVGNFGFVHASTEVIGIMNADTTWTKSNSPYNLTGNMAIEKGVTLTIEPGVTINLNNFYMQVNGTLIARGSRTDNIRFNGVGSIEFTASSTSWNEQTGTGCIIENANLRFGALLKINRASPKINNNSIDASILIKGGSPVITNNSVMGSSNYASIIIAGGSPIISSNNITSYLGQNVGYWTKFGIGFEFEYYDDYLTYYKTSEVYISNNRIFGCQDAGIGCDGGSFVGKAIIERNWIFDNNYFGLKFLTSANLIIQNNTISDNPTGIGLIDSSNAKVTVAYNNIENTVKNSIWLSISQSDIEASHNWWGTTDSSAIAKSIYDFDDDFSLGKVNFTPFLTERNSQAMPDPNIPIPASNSSSSASPSPSLSPEPEKTPSPSPDQDGTLPAQPDQSDTQSGIAVNLNETEIAILAVLIVIAALLIVLTAIIVKKKR